ncbi:MAG: hypothetical protein V2A67_09060 [Bacteroidota bacterium]
MKSVRLVVLILILSGSQMVTAQQPANWDSFKHLFGEWVGEGNGQPGQGIGSFTFATELEGNILTRRSHTAFPATADRPAFVHDDFMVIYPDYSGVPSKAIYWDNEHHTIEYAVSFSDKAVVFTSAAMQNMPRFRLTYETIDAQTINVKFEMSNPQTPDEFRLYLEGKSMKIK